MFEVWVAAALAVGVGAPAVEVPAKQPAVTLQIVAARDGTESGRPVTVFVVFSNQSSLTLSRLALSIRSDAFKPPAPLRTTAAGPFATVSEELTLTPVDGARFGGHAVMFTVDYQWQDGKESRTSAAVATVPLEIKYPFEDEAKGLPGGTAPLLWLLLPVIPAFLSFKFVEQLRAGKALEVPAFGAVDIPFAFFIAITVGALRLFAPFSASTSSPSTAVFMLVAVSAAAGALVPAGRWGVASFQTWRWRFRPDDPADVYLRRVFFGPSSQSGLRWVTGTAGTRQYAGLWLRQPDGSPALGARLQVSLRGGLSAEERARAWSALQSDVVDTTGRVSNAQRLIEMIRSEALTVDFLERIVAGGTASDRFVLTDDLDGFTEAPGAAAQPVVSAVA
jgi:hypothetical protein